MREGERDLRYVVLSIWYPTHRPEMREKEYSSEGERENRKKGEKERRKEKFKLCV